MKNVNVEMTAKLAEIHAKFAYKLVNSLSHFYSQEEREDAVAEAFRILMTEGCPEGSRVPQTDKEWFAKIRYRARGCLSNAVSKSQIRAKYTHRAANEPQFIPYYYDPRATLDMKTVRKALNRTLDILFKEHRISDRDKDVFLRLLDGEAADSAAKDYGITANHAYQINFCIRKRLRKYGRRYYARALREVGNQ